MTLHDKISVLLEPRPRKIISSLNSTEEPEANEPRWFHNFKDLHSHREAMLVLEGQNIQSLNGHLYSGTPNTLFLFNSFELHDQGYSSESPDGAHLWLFIFPSVINCIFDTTRNGSQFIERRIIFRRQDLIALLQRVWDAAAGRTSPETALLELNAAFALIFSELARLLQTPEKESEMHRSHQQEAINEVKKYLNHTCGRDSDISSLARLAGYSRPHFLRLFRQYAGCRVQEYIDSRRLQRYELLRGQRAPMKEIAAELGFSSSAALAHWRKNKIIR